MRDFSTIFTVRTDLASEIRELWREKNSTEPDGTRYENRKICGVDVDFLEVLNTDGEKITGKPKGRYCTLNVGKVWESDRCGFDNAMQAMSKIIRSLVPENAKSCLVAGLGNSGIIADAVGPFAVSNVIVTHHIKKADHELFTQMGMSDVMSICPGVLGNTGIEGADVVASVVKEEKPDFVIAIDALASRRLSRLATTVQICDTGISPGSGINNTRKTLCNQTLGVPVIAIGVPTVVEAATLAYDLVCSVSDNAGVDRGLTDSIKNALSENPIGFFVTPKETDHIVKDVSKLIGYAINLALNSDLSKEEIDEFLS